MNKKNILLKINPNVKTIISMILTLANTLAFSIYSKIFLLVFLIILLILYKNRIRFKKIKTIFMFALVSCISGFCCSKGDSIFKIGFINITDDSIRNSFMMFSSMSIFWMISLIMINSISASEIPYVAEFFLSPLKKLGVKISEISMIITLSVRFIPVVLKESRKIMIAQESRGAVISRGSPVKRLKFLLSAFLPIFTSCFRRAINIATAMECRCYGAPFERTKLKENKFTKIDLIALIFALLVCLGVFFCNTVKIF